MICLIRPPCVESVRLATTTVQPPLGLAYVAAALEAAGSEIQVLDAVTNAPKLVTKYLVGYLIGERLEDLAARVPSDAEWVGITVVFTHEWPMVVRLVELIKARLPHVPVVLGGEHVTSMPEFCLMSSKGDYLVLGEGEETVVELCDVIRGKREARSVDGIAFRERGEIVVNRRRQRRAEVDTIPYPAWQLFDVATYHENRFCASIYTDKLTVPILATRGCPYQCTYCASPNMWTPKWIPRDPVKVVDEIEHWVRTLGAGNFPFQDLTAIVRKDWIVAFCKELLRRKLDITWQLPVGTRSEAIDGEVAQLLKQTNMISMAYAPESGSEETRKLVKKKIDEEPLFESVKAAVDAGLNVSFYIIVGLPHETVENLRANLRFLERAANAGITDISVGYYMAIPGTEIFNSLYGAGKIRMDRQYFVHMLYGLAPFPVVSFSEDLTWTDLFVWKFRLFGRFYSTRSRLEGGLLAKLGRAVSGFADGAHQTKMQTAVRSITKSVASLTEAALGQRWMPKALEEVMFDDWDAMFRRAWDNKLSKDAESPYPADTRDLHLGNVIRHIKKEHETSRRLTVLSNAPSA